ncbi:MAG: PASTA domain-containing protein [Ruminococcaceae bacterium]|nr:PASTA domain-containing protein [Oscillospiraceae bacterium]
MIGGVNGGLLKRAAFLFGFLLLVFLLLLLRIAKIQTVDFEKYEEKVIDQMTTRSPASANRGEIYDRNGKVLATNVTTYRVFLSPSAISRAQKTLDGRKTDSIAREIASTLSELLGLDYDTVYQKAQKVGRLDETLMRDADEEVAAKLRTWILEKNMVNLVFLEATSKRYYPYGSLASHIIGFTSTDGVGLYGLEYQYNDTIDGTDGYYVTARDSRGNEMPDEYQSYVAAEDGLNITTTIDSYVQAALEEQLENAVLDSGALNRACGIVMDVTTGEILALAVYPSFDLNDPWELAPYYKQKLAASGLVEGSEEYSTLARQYLLESWSNKALTETYIPGSTFKILTSSMALEENLSLLKNSIFCGGSKNVLGQNIHCHKRKGHGSLTFAEGIQHSCNVWFMSIGQSLGIDRFTKYYKQFGYREKTGIDLPGEGMGVISSRMTELDLAIYSFGQNFTVTAIQHLSAIAAVANGGTLLKPYVVKNASDIEGNVVFENTVTPKRTVVTAATAKTLSEILAAGVAGEGGAKNAYVAGYRVAAKTGTSEKKGVTTTGTEMYICSCVGYAPADDPKYAMILMVDEPTKGLLYGSTVAAPYIAKTFETILPYLGVEPVYTEAEEKLMDAVIPNYVGLETSAAVSFAESRGLAVTVVGEGKYVVSQSPKSQSLYSGESGKIIFYTDDTKESQAVVPDVMGKTLVEANAAIAAAGFNIQIGGVPDADGKGGAVVVSQLPIAGTLAERGSVVSIELRYMIKDD